MANEVPTQNRRRFFRVKYPEHARPIARLGNHAGAAVASVVDISETGLRLLVGRTSSISKAEPGDMLSGTLILHDDFGYIISGRVVRREGTFVALELDDVRVPFQVVVAEQRWLRRWFERHRLASKHAPR